MAERETTVTELILTVQSIVAEGQYSQNYKNDLAYQFKKIMLYFEQKGIKYYSPVLGEQFLSEVCGIVPGEPSRRCSCAQRAINMITEYQRIGAIAPRRTSGREFPPRFFSYANSYMEKLRREFKRPSTLLRIKSILLKFTEYLEQNNLHDISSLTPDDVNSYYKNCLKNYSEKHVQDCINSVKRFLHYLYETGVIPNDISLQLLEIHCPNTPKHLPDIFTDEEIEQILSAVDKESPVGKRDYAILLIAARLGLRQSDIKSLKPSNFDWDKEEINLVQVKTGKPLQLPLPQDVGWAVIEYIKDCRPKCDTPEIFVRCKPPYTPLTNYDAMLSKYMRLAGISMVNRYHHGFHTFRHSLATRMLKENIPLTDIQEVLGHSTAGATKIYTRVDTDQLAECALEVPLL